MPLAAARTQVSYGRGKEEYCYDEAELRSFLKGLGSEGSPTIQRFKGLGEAHQALC